MTSEEIKHTVTKILGNREKDEKINVIFLVESKTMLAGAVGGPTDELAEMIVRNMNKNDAFRILVESAVYAINEQEGTNFAKKMREVTEWNDERDS